jgi:hypothetical protein
MYAIFLNTSVQSVVHQNKIGQSVTLDSVFLFMFNSAAIARTDTPSINLVVITAFCFGVKFGIVIVII